MLALLLALLSMPGGAQAGTAPAVVPDLRAPVAGALLRGFDLPAPHGPGHRGVDLQAAPGTPVRAPVGGRVRFAGTVAGVRWVTLAHGTRVLVSVGPLADVGVRRGDVVVAGSLLGTARGAHDGGAALHLSLRVDGSYRDPGPHLRRRPPRATLVGPPGAMDTVGVVGVGTPPAADRGVPALASPVPWGRLR